MTRVVLAPGLRPLCNGQAVIESDAASTGDLVKELVAAFPGLKPLAGEDRARWAIELFLNGATADRLTDAPLAAGDEVVVFHPIAGG